MVDLMTLPHHTTAHHAPTEPQSPTRQQSVDLQADNWLYEIRQKGQNTACYVMVQNVQVRKVIIINFSSSCIICIRVDSQCNFMKLKTKRIKNDLLCRFLSSINIVVFL